MTAQRGLGTPTGREPRLIWTPQRQATWARMRADFESSPSTPRTLGGKYYKLIKDNAECKCRYADTGLWATLMFQFTGDRKYSDLAWGALEAGFLQRSRSQLGGNYAREYAAEYVLQYDWLYPALNDAQRAAFISKLNDLFDVALTNTSNPSAPVRTADSDQTIGVYFGLAFLYVATADQNSKARDYFNRPFVGGLSATARDRSTLRNAVRDYVEMAEGGEFIESSEYNVGTVRLLLLGAEGVKTATREEHFPEIASWLPDAALRAIYMATPDLAQAYQWGDTEHPGDFLGQMFDWQTTSGVVAGIADPDSARYLNQQIATLAARHGEVGNRFSEPWARMFLTFDPYASGASPESLPLGWHARGQGIVTYRTGWDSQASLFGAHFPNQQPFVDHQVSYFGDIQLYRSGGWALTHPLGYGGPAILGPATNTLIHAGFGSMLEFRRLTAAEFGRDVRYAYVSGTTGGQKYNPSYYQPPPTYLHEWTRSVLYLPSSNRAFDTIVIFDRSHAEDPRGLAAFPRYSAADRQTISAHSGIRQWLLHAPVRPNIDGDRIAWDVRSGDLSELTMLLPRDRDTTAIDETQLWTTASMQAGQRKWMIRIVPDEERKWLTFLNVLNVHDRSRSATAELVTSTTAEDVQGALVHREGQNDVVALFNAEPGPSLNAGNSSRGAYEAATQSTLQGVRLKHKGFTVQWTSATNATDVFVADLDPGRTWQYRVDGGPSTGLSLSEAGLGRFVVSGSRTHTLIVF